VPSSPPASVAVRRSRDRFRTRAGGLDTRHSFSGSRHYEPANTSFGLLVLHDEHVVAPGAGFDHHRHRGIEVVTWVLDGRLRHEDSTGGCGVLAPGQVQRMHSGAGIVHAERNDRVDGPVRFVQAWLVADDAGPPSTALGDVGDLLDAGALVPVASGRRPHEAAVSLSSPDVALHAARLSPAQAVQLPEAPFLHLFLTRGDVELEGAGGLATGDAVRLTATGGRRVTATTPGEVLVWEMHTALR
jgi:redox-sensitive bicupin YhaK (pirin superfamily)